MGQTASCRRSRGFTLIELIIAMALIGILALIGFPALFRNIQRSKHEAFVRTVAATMRAARLEAIRFSTEVYVEPDTAAGELVTLRENGTTAGKSADDEEVNRIPLPPQMLFAGPAADNAAITGFGGATFATFGSRGTLVDATGRLVTGISGIRVSDASLYNSLEIRVDPPATARIVLVKWDPSANAWKEQGESGISWEWN